MSQNLPEIQWLGHASLLIKSEAGNILVDPWKVVADYNAVAVLITHSHFDHLSINDIRKTLSPGGTIIAPPDCLEELKNDFNCIAVKPGQTVDQSDFSITATPAYNPKKEFHQKQKNWVGYLIKVDNTTVYVAGDTDLIPEMAEIKADIAILPVGGTYTMNYAEAAEAVKQINPKIAIPIHFGDIVGEANDGQKFARQLPNHCVKILEPLSKNLI